MSSQGTRPGQMFTVDEYSVGDALTIDGYGSTLDWGDLFSRSIRCIPLNMDLTSEDVAQLFVDHILRNAGKPQEVRSDRGSVLISAAIKALYSRFGILLVDGASHQHKIVAFVERWHQTLQRLLDAFRLGTGERRWYLYISLLELCFNTTKNSTTGYTPFFLEHLRQASLPYDTLSSDAGAPTPLPD